MAMLSNMPPCFAEYDGGNQRRADIVPLRYGIARLASRNRGADIVDGIFGQLGGVVPLAATVAVVAPPAPFVVHVKHVVRARAEEQVSGPDAAAVVATVAHMEPVWDDAVVKRPREPVGPLMEPPALPRPFDKERSIPIPESVCGPKPAVAAPLGGV